MTLAIAAAEPATVPLESLTRDPDLCMRAAGVSAETVAEYAEAMQAGAVFPPVVVFVDAKGLHHLSEGFHRCAAAELAGLSEVAADLRQGGRREALLHAAGSNGQHGLRRTQADVRRAIALLLGALPRHSDRKIAALVGCHNETVGAVRKGLTESVTPTEPGASSGGGPVDVGKLAERLAKAFAKGMALCPEGQRQELRAALLRLLEGLS